MTKKLLGSIVMCLLVVIFMSLSQFVFMLFGFLVFFIPLSLYSIYRIIKRSEDATIRKYKLVIWWVGILIPISINYSYYISARSKANTAVAIIVGYEKENGRYPSKEEILNSITNKYDIIYELDDGEPVALYKSPFLTFNYYRYDFSTKIWLYVVD